MKNYFILTFRAGILIKISAVLIIPDRKNLIDFQTGIEFMSSMFDIFIKKDSSRMINKTKTSTSTFVLLVFGFPANVKEKSIYLNGKAIIKKRRKGTSKKVQRAKKRIGNNNKTEALRLTWPNHNHQRTRWKCRYCELIGCMCILMAFNRWYPRIDRNYQNM